MAEVKKGDRVRLHYTGKFDDGEVFDSSRGGEPLEFVVGRGEVIGGVDSAVVGMAPEETRTVTVAAADAYGDYDERLVHEVPRDTLPEEISPEVGQRLQATHNDGQTVILTVREVKEESVLLDANHPLAGRDLTFELELLEVA